MHCYIISSDRSMLYRRLYVFLLMFLITTSIPYLFGYFLSQHLKFALTSKRHILSEKYSNRFNHFIQNVTTSVWLSKKRKSRISTVVQKYLMKLNKVACCHFLFREMHLPVSKMNVELNKIREQ